MSARVETLGARFRATPGLLELGVSLILTLLLVLSLIALNKWLDHFYNFADTRPAIVSTVPILGGLAFAIVFARTRYSDFIPLMSLALRSSALGLLTYLIAEPVDFTLANPDAAGAAQYVQIGYFAAIALAILSAFRPSFLIPVAFYLTSTRLLVEGISGLWMSTLDIRYMVDMAMYLAIFGIIATRVGPSIHAFFRSEKRQEEIALAAFGLHLGNYFWSGFGKLHLGPYPWTWPLENRTFNMIPFSIEKGALPIGHLPWLVQPVYDVMQVLVVPLNLAIVGAQLFALVCVFRLSWLKIASILYDLLHIGIYVLGGLFFWPWIWNNFTILIAATVQKKPIALSAKAVCVFTILLLGFPQLGVHGAAWLAWFDVVDARQTYFEAVTEDGGHYRVPSSFFLSHSYSVSHRVMDRVPHPGQYASTQWASTKDYQRFLTSGSCPPPPPVDPRTLETEKQHAARLERIGRFIRAHHAKMLEREAWLGSGSYYFRLHHHPSNPFLFTRWNGIKLDQVIGYNLVVESVCHRLSEGHVEKTVVGHIEDFFSVR